MIIYRFQVIQISRDPSLSIFMLLEQYGISSPPYTESKWNLKWWEAKSPGLSYTDGKRNPPAFDENIITNKSQHKKNSETSKSTPFSIQIQWKKVWSWMSNTRGNQQLWNWRRVFG